MSYLRYVPTTYVYLLQLVYLRYVIDRCYYLKQLI